MGKTLFHTTVHAHLCVYEYMYKLREDDIDQRLKVFTKTRQELFDMF